MGQPVGQSFFAFILLSSPVSSMPRTRLPSISSSRTGLWFKSRDRKVRSVPVDPKQSSPFS